MVCQCHGTLSAQLSAGSLLWLSDNFDTQNLAVEGASGWSLLCFTLSQPSLVSFSYSDSHSDHWLPLQLHYGICISLAAQASNHALAAGHPASAAAHPWCPVTLTCHSLQAWCIAALASAKWAVYTVLSIQGIYCIFCKWCCLLLLGPLILVEALLCVSGLKKISIQEF